MKSDSPSWTNPAMQVIKDHDPDLYRRISNDEWNVCVITTGNEPGIPPGWDGYELLLELSHAFGATDRRGHAPTWLNRPAIEEKAQEMGVPVKDFLADVLVHEYTHHDEDLILGHSTEASAFAAGTQFARRLGAADLPIVRLSAETARRESF
jgi:hypothetical protein